MKPDTCGHAMKFHLYQKYKVHKTNYCWQISRQWLHVCGEMTGMGCEVEGVASGGAGNVLSPNLGAG